VHAKVIQLSRDLGWASRGEPGDYVVRYCLDVVERWIGTYEPSTLDDLLATVTAHMGIRVDEFHSDEELEAICERYKANAELTFERVRQEFAVGDTFALTVRLKCPQHGMKFVAVIDCRGSRALKRLFSIWHEIAHLLVNPQLALEFRRCAGASKDPVESLMDRIAGELAFHRKWF
jgi:hypothetical protein